MVYLREVESHPPLAPRQRRRSAAPKHWILWTDQPEEVASAADPGPRRSPGPPGPVEVQRWNRQKM